MQKMQLIRANTGRNYDYSQDHCFVKVSSVDTNGELSMVEDVIKPGFKLPRHHHKIMTETFYMISGAIDLIFDDETITLSPGDTLTIPPNVWHAAESKNGGKMLTIFKNGQFDLYLERLSQMSDEDFSNAEMMKSINKEFDIYNA